MKPLPLVILGGSDRTPAELPESGSAIAIGDATLRVDDDPIYTIKRAKVGLFRDLSYRDYPHASEHAKLVKSTAPELCFGCHNRMLRDPQGRALPSARMRANSSSLR